MYLAHNYGFLAYSASMEGRGEESLRAARESAHVLAPEMLEMMPGMDFFVSEPLLAMVRFGRWDELLAEPRPDAKYPVLTGPVAARARDGARRARGRFDEARAEHAELVKLAAQVPADLTAGNNTARDVLGVAAQVLEAPIAEQQGQPDALARWDAAVRAADKLAYSEPADWFYPVRHYQGAALLKARRWKEAEAVYREDLRRNPNNGWALFGLAQALEGQGRSAEAAQVQQQFQKAWARADVQLTRTALRGAPRGPLTRAGRGWCRRSCCGCGPWPWCPRPRRVASSPGAPARRRAAGCSSPPGAAWGCGRPARCAPRGGCR